MLFPSDPNRDVNIIYSLNTSAKRAKGKTIECDVKEFTPFEKDFSTFLKKNIKPRVGTKVYHSIIGVSHNISHKELLELASLSSKTSTIWTVSAVSESSEDNQNDFVTEMLVTMLQGKDFISPIEIDLKKDAPLHDGPAIVFNNTPRFIFDGQKGTRPE